MRPTALQIISPSGERDTGDVRAPARLPLAHLSSEKVAEALKAAHGVMADAARRLKVSRDKLYLRCHADPIAEAARTEARETFVDLAESELYKLVASGNPSAIIYTLRTVGHARGWREGVVVEQEAAPRPRVDMTAALRALSPDELLQLEGLVSKLEANARLEARDRDADDDGSRRPSRRRHLRGEVAASDAVAEVEAVAASGEVELTAEANCLATEQLNPGDLTKPE